MSKVLVVDDEQDMVEMLRYNLNERGYDVLSASNGLEAIKQARNHQPDLVLLDLMLDGMDGFTVCEILRQQPSTSSVPIIMITAQIGEMIRRNGLDSGADDVINKPFSPEKLMNRMEKVFEARRERRQKMEAEEAFDRTVRRALRIDN